VRSCGEAEVVSSPLPAHWLVWGWRRPRILWRARLREVSHRHLRPDPRFLARTPEEVAARLIAAVGKISHEGPLLCLSSAQAQYGVERAARGAGRDALRATTRCRPPPAARPTSIRRFAISTSAAAWSSLASLSTTSSSRAITPGCVCKRRIPSCRRSDATFSTPLRLKAGASTASHLGEEWASTTTPYALYGRAHMDIFALLPHLGWWTTVLTPSAGAAQVGF